MDLGEIIKSLGVPGAVGILAGIALASWAGTGAKGSLLLILLAVCLAVVAFAAAKALWRWLAPGRPPDPPAGD
ncbi:hypothetical protein [Paracoccus sp. (in: a-proteobacteria)]|uniref:hypothetical protein n=1 Tax=Paracoccus sp. TaxID=267 RepID=UPI00321FF805